MEHQIELTAENLWGEVSSRLRGALNEATFRPIEGLVGGRWVNLLPTKNNPVS